MEFTDIEGNKYEYSGPLCSCYKDEGKSLSDLVRETVGMDDLYVFDGKCE